MGGPIYKLAVLGRYIRDYLLEEVFNHGKSCVREFLLRTCMVVHFNVDLCSVLCAEEASVAEGQSMVVGLERANLFIIPFDH